MSIGQTTGSYVTGRPDCLGPSCRKVKIDVWKYLQTIVMGLYAVCEEKLDNQHRALRPQCKEKTTQSPGSENVASIIPHPLHVPRPKQTHRETPSIPRKINLFPTNHSSESSFFNSWIEERRRMRVEFLLKTDEWIDELINLWWPVYTYTGRCVCLPHWSKIQRRKKKEGKNRWNSVL